MNAIQSEGGWQENTKNKVFRMDCQQQFLYRIQDRPGTEKEAATLPELVHSA